MTVKKQKTAMVSKILMEAILFQRDIKLLAAIANPDNLADYKLDPVQVEAERRIVVSQGMQRIRPTQQSVIFARGREQELPCGGIEQRVEQGCEAVAGGMCPEQFIEQIQHLAGLMSMGGVRAE